MGSPPPSPPIVSINCPGYDPIGTSRTFTATTDISCSIAIYFDGVLKASGSGISLSYNAGPGIFGHHVVQAIASNIRGSSEALCDWYVYDPISCEPFGPFLLFPVFQWRPDGSSEWQNANHCTVNAAINYAYTGNPNEQDRTLLQNCQWKRNSNCGDETVQFYIPTSGSAGLHVYHVAIFSDFCPILSQKAHAALALFHGSGPEEYSTWEKWQKFQYGDLNIQIGSACGDQIPKPQSPDDQKTRIAISEVTGYADCTSLLHGPILVNFYIDYNGNVSLDPYN